MTSSYNRRQLEKMKNLLKSFKRGSTTLSSLTSSIEFLLQAMEGVDENWEESFFEEICVLASLNAGLPPRCKKEEIDNIINETLRNINNLIDSALKFK